MKFVRNVTVCLILFCSSVPAQVPARQAFEVASIKPLPSMQVLIADLQSGTLNPKNLGMRVDGARVDIGLATLSGLIATAYKVKTHQISGPDWMASQLFEIHATLPQGASKDQVPEMIQSLLIERFKMKAHAEKKEQEVYALVVAKGGPKLKEAVEEPQPPAAASGKDLIAVDTPEGQVKVKQEGRAMVISSSGSRKMRLALGENGTVRMEIDKAKASEFADMLTQFVDRPVVDMTELPGRYQFPLEVSQDEIINIARRVMPDLAIPASAAGGMTGAAPASGLSGMAASDPSGGGIFRAVQQLGLKLDSRKAPVDTIIIDSIEKTPTEN